LILELSQKLDLTPDKNMQKFLVFVIVLAIIVLVIFLLASGKSKLREKISLFLADSEERRAASRQAMAGGKKQTKTSVPPKSTPVKPMSDGEKYYEKGGNKKPSSQLKIEMVKLIRKSDDRLRVIEANGQSRLFDEFYQLVFKNRRGEIIKVECSKKAYNELPFNLEGSLSYQKNRFVKFKSIEGTVHDV